LEFLSIEGDVEGFDDRRPLGGLLAQKSGGFMTCPGLGRMLRSSIFFLNSGSASTAFRISFSLSRTGAGVSAEAVTI